MSKDNLIAKIPVPDDYLIELGKITVMYGMLEFSVDRAISSLSGFEGVLDWRISIMTVHLSFQQRINVLSTLFEQLADANPTIKGYEKLIEKLKKVQTLRNRYIHSSYTSGNKSEVAIWSLSARGAFNIKTQDVYIQDLRNVSVQINAVRLQLEELITGK